MTDVVPETPPPANRGLWMLVIGLGIAILIVVAAMIGLALRRVYAKPDEASAPPPATVAIRPGDTPELNIDLEQGEIVADANLQDGRLVVRLTSSAGDRLMVLDPKTSKVLSRIRFNRPAGPGTGDEASPGAGATLPPGPSQP